MTPKQWLALATLAVVPLAQAQNPSRVDRVDFRIEFPAGFPEPVAATETVGQIVVHVYAAATETLVCAVSYQDLPKAEIDTSEFALKGVLTGLRNEGTLVEQELFSRTGCPAARAFVQLAETHKRFEAVVSGGRLYMMMAEAPRRTTLSSPAVERFFGSFELKAPDCTSKPHAYTDTVDAKRDFRVDLPAGFSPFEAKELAAASDGRIYTSIGATGVCLVMSVALSEQERTFPAEQILHMAIWGFANDRVIDREESFTKAGLPAKRAEIRGGAGFGRVEAVLAGERLYVIHYGGVTRDSLGHPDVDRFFRSFEINGKTP